MWATGVGHEFHHKVREVVMFEEELR